ncbi:hypothetical protein U973_01641 [Staphylococcus aureus 56864-11]|nr:hypothetical protein U973_01641 [Staphylococcus aureus 56864-11]
MKYKGEDFNEFKTGANPMRHKSNWKGGGF